MALLEEVGDGDPREGPRHGQRGLEIHFVGRDPLFGRKRLAGREELVLLRLHLLENGLLLVIGEEAGNGNAGGELRDLHGRKVEDRLPLPSRGLGHEKDHRRMAFPFRRGLAAEEIARRPGRRDEEDFEHGKDHTPEAAAASTEECRVRPGCGLDLDAEYGKLPFVTEPA